MPSLIILVKYNKLTKLLDSAYKEDKKRLFTIDFLLQYNKYIDIKKEWYDYMLENRKNP